MYIYERTFNCKKSVWQIFDRFDWGYLKVISSDCDETKYIDIVAVYDVGKEERDEQEKIILEVSYNKKTENQTTYVEEEFTKIIDKFITKLRKDYINKEKGDRNDD